MNPFKPFATALAAGLLLIAAAAPAHAQVWRCGNEYTNDAASAKARGCKTMEGGNLTVIQGTRPSSLSSTSSSSSQPVVRAPAGSPRVEGVDQRARDNDARGVLETELRKAETRLSELNTEYKGGEPDKQGSEARNYQKYLDRVSDMKAEIARTEADVAGLRREIGRQPAPR